MGMFFFLKRTSRRAANYIKKKDIPEGRTVQTPQPKPEEEKRKSHNRAARDELRPAGKSGEIFSPRQNPAT